MAEEPFDSLSSRLRRLSDRPVSALGRALHRLGVHPDLITVVGTALAALSGVFVARGAFRKASLLWLLGGPLDLLDGAVARAMGRKDSFGALLDSSLDRCADGALAAGLGVYFAREAQTDGVAVSSAAMLGAFMVSYVRARAEGLGLPSIKGGLLSRFERSVLWFAMLYTGRVKIGIWLMAIVTNITAAQRLFIGRRLAREAAEKGE